MADEDLVIRAQIDASGTQTGAAQAVAAFNQMKVAQDDVAASATKATVAINAETASVAGSAASVRDGAAAHRELAAAMAIRPSGVPFGTLEATANRVAEAYSNAARAASGVGVATGAATFATPASLNALDRDLRRLPVLAAESAAGIATAFSNVTIPRNTFTAISKDLREVQDVASLAATGVATAFTAAAVPQATLKAVTADLSTSLAAEAESAGAVGVALGEGAAVSSATLAAVGRDLAKTQGLTEQAAHGISTAMEAAFVAPSSLRTIGAAVQQQASMAERASHGIRTAMEAAFVAPAALKSLGQDIVGTLARSGDEAKATLAGKIVSAASEAGVAYGAVGGTIKKVAEETAHLNLATSGSIREFIVLGHEAMVGNFSRMPGSLVVLAERAGGLSTIFQALTAANIAMGAGAIAAVGGIAYLIYQLYEEKRAVEEVSAALLLTGQTGPSMNFDNIRAGIKGLKEDYGAWTSEARSAVAAFAGITTVTEQQRRQLEGLAVAIAHFSHGDVEKVAQELSKAVGAGAAGVAKYAVEIGAVTESEKALILSTQGDGQATQTLIDKIIEFGDRGVGAFERVDTAAKGWQRTLQLAAGLMAGGEGDPFAGQALVEAFPEARRPDRPGSPEAARGGAVRDQYADFLRKQLGYTAEDAAALIGQIQQESSLNPLAGQGGAHQGLAQWDNSRFAELQAYAKSIGGDWKDWQVQLRFANEEIKKMAPEFFKIQGLAEKTKVLTGQFEKPAITGTPEFDKEVKKRLDYSTQALGPIQRQSPQEADADRAIDSGNKKLEERRKIQTQIEDAARGLQSTESALRAAEADGNGALTDQLSKRRDEQQEAIRNLEVRKAGVHSEEEADAHRAEMTRLHAAQEIAQKRNDQTTLQQLAAQEAAAEEAYAGNTADAKARSEQLIQKAREAASQDALNAELNRIRVEGASGKGAQNRIDEIKAEAKALDDAGRGSTDQRRALDVQLAQAQRQLLDEEYQEFVAKERLKIAEAKASPAEIIRIYDEWLGQVKSVYGQDEREFARVQAGKVEAVRRANADVIGEQMRLANTHRTVDQQQLGLERAAASARVDAAQVAGGGAEQARIDAYAQELALIQRLAAEETRRYQAIIDNDASTTAEKERAYSQQLEIASRAAEQEMQLAKKVADEQKRQFEDSARVFRSAFSSAGSAVESALDGVLTGQKNAAQVVRDLMQSLEKDVLHTVTGLASQKLAESLGGAPGKGLSDVLGDKVARLFGIAPKAEGESVRNAAQAAANEELRTFATTLAKVNALLDKQSTDVGAAKAGMPAPSAALPASDRFSVAPGASLTKGNEPALADITAHAAAALPPGYKVVITSGSATSGHVAGSAHYGDRAIDRTIYDPSGKKVPNTGEDTTGMYGRLSDAEDAYQREAYPQYTGFYRRGSEFGAHGGKVGQGDVADLMHRDVQGYAGAPPVVARSIDTMTVGTVTGVDVEELRLRATESEARRSSQRSDATQVQPQEVNVTQVAGTDLPPPDTAVPAPATSPSLASAGSEISALTNLLSPLNSGTRAIGSAVSSGLSLVKGATSLVSLFAAEGAVVPSAEHGMKVGARGGLAILHPEEMVLPSHIRSGLEGMIASMEDGGVISAAEGSVIPAGASLSGGLFSYFNRLFPEAPSYAEGDKLPFDARQAPNMDIDMEVRPPLAEKRFDYSTETSHWSPGTLDIPNFYNSPSRVNEPESLTDGGVISAAKGTIVSSPPTSTGFWTYGQPLYEQLRTNDPGGFDPKSVATSSDIKGTVDQGKNLEVIAPMTKITPTTFTVHPSTYTGATGSAGGLTSASAFADTKASEAAPAAASQALTRSREVVNVRETIDAKTGTNWLRDLALLGGGVAAIAGLAKLFGKDASGEEGSDFSGDATAGLGEFSRTTSEGSDFIGGSLDDVLGAISGEKGVVVPSAAGGMAVNDGKGGQLAILHPEEMVLPRDLSIGVQRMISRGGRLPSAAGGGLFGDADNSIGAASFGSNLSNIAVTPADLQNNTSQLLTSTTQNLANTTATISNTLALQRATANQDKGPIGNAVGAVNQVGSAISAVKTIGSIASFLFLKEGGVIPSAAGGMLAGGGQMAILHPHEMVLPAPLSQGVQGLIENGGAGRQTVNAGDVNLSYAPTINAPGNPSLGQLLERHSQTMVDWIHSNVRSGTLKLPAF